MKKGEIKFPVQGYDMRRKTAKQQKGATSSNIYLPSEWDGKEVVVILAEELEEEGDDNSEN